MEVSLLNSVRSSHLLRHTMYQYCVSPPSIPPHPGCTHNIIQQLVSFVRSPPRQFLHLDARRSLVLLLELRARWGVVGGDRESGSSESVVFKVVLCEQTSVVVRTEDQSVSDLCLAGLGEVRERSRGVKTDLR
jgi:hypothetical protein